MVSQMIRSALVQGVTAKAYIYICKARNNRCAYNGQCLTWKGIGDPQGL